jgi:hypothetical protein
MPKRTRSYKKRRSKKLNKYRRRTIKRRYRRGGGNTERDYTNECPVCLEVNERCILKPCNHQLCKTCLVKLPKPKICPLCREPITSAVCNGQTLTMSQLGKVVPERPPLPITNARNLQILNAIFKNEEWEFIPLDQHGQYDWYFQRDRRFQRG